MPGCLCSYASFLAASHDPRQASTVWLTYWVLFGVVCQVELSLQSLIDWYGLTAPRYTARAAHVCEWHGVQREP